MNRIVSWLLVAGALALALAVVGFLLPSGQSEQRIASYSRAPDEVWDAIADFTGRARWRKAIQRVHALPDVNGHPAYRELGPDYQRTYQVLSIAAPRRLELHFDEADHGFRGRWTFDLEAHAGGTRLTLTESGDVQNVFARVACRTLVDRGDELELFLVELGRLFDEDVLPSEVTEAPLPVRPLF